MGVSDGATIAVLSGGRVKVRLDGIDCPEGSPPFSRRAKEFTPAVPYKTMMTVKARPIRPHAGRSDPHGRPQPQRGDCSRRARAVVPAARSLRSGLGAVGGGDASGAPEAVGRGGAGVAVGVEEEEGSGDVKLSSGPLRKSDSGLHNGPKWSASELTSAQLLHARGLPEGTGSAMGSPACPKSPRHACAAGLAIRAQLRPAGLRPGRRGASSPAPGLPCLLRRRGIGIHSCQQYT